MYIKSLEKAVLQSYTLGFQFYKIMGCVSFFRYILQIVMFDNFFDEYWFEIALWNGFVQSDLQTIKDVSTH
jgi:hypothetical protein